MESEVWKDISGYEGHYKVSSLGRIASLKYNKIRYLKYSIDSGGYYQVEFSMKSVQVKYIVHRILAIHFIPNPNNLPEVNHKNYNKLDIRLSNLEWCTRKENADHSYLMKGRKKTQTWLGKLGGDHNCSIAVKQIDPSTNKVVKIFGSTTEVNRVLKINHSHVSEVARGNTNRKTAGGYKWAYVK